MLVRSRHCSFHLDLDAITRMSGRLMHYTHISSSILGVWNRCLALNCASEIANHATGGHNCPPLLSCSLSGSVVIPLLRLGAFIAFSWNLTDWQQTGQFRKQLNGSVQHQQTPSPAYICCRIPTHHYHVHFHFLYITFCVFASSFWALAQLQKQLSSSTQLLVNRRLILLRRTFSASQSVLCVCQVPLG